VPIPQSYPLSLQCLRARVLGN